MNLVCRKLASNETVSNEEILNFLQDNGLIPKTVKCSFCASELSLVKAMSVGDSFFLRCNLCKRKRTIREGTVFGGSKLSLLEILKLVVYFCEEVSLKDTVRLLSNSKSTVVAWNLKFRKSCSRYLEATFNKVGGNGTEVQIDETVINKRKYNKGRLVREKWLFGAIDTVSKSFVLRNIPNRKAFTLSRVIKETIAEDTAVVSDMWPAYISLFSKEPGYTHKTVNHSRHYVDPVTGVHTNLVENLWMRLKNKLRTKHLRCADNLQGYLDEFCFRYNFDEEEKDLMFATILKNLE